MPLMEYFEKFKQFLNFLTKNRIKKIYSIKLNHGADLCYLMNRPTFSKRRERVESHSLRSTLSRYF